MIYAFLVDKAENPQKCSILPLEGRGDFRITRFDRSRPIPRVEADLLLHLDGPPLDEIRGELASVRSLAFIDCHWKRCGQIVQRIEPPLPRLARIPPGFKTAYPRRNKENKDPEDGLATIEAVFIAAAFAGVWDETLFDKYHWGKAFLELNAETFARYGVAGGSRP